MMDTNEIIAELRKAVAVGDSPVFCGASVIPKAVAQEAADRLEKFGELIRDLSDNIPCCDNCEGKTVYGERTDKCVYEIEGIDSVIYCASRGIQNCFGYRKRIDELEADRDHLLKIAKKMHLWIFHNTCDEYAAYKECGLTDEDDARLGYGGQFVLTVEGKSEDEQ